MHPIRDKFNSLVHMADKNIDALMISEKIDSSFS